MFKEFLNLINCCKKRKNDDSESLSDYENDIKNMKKNKPNDLKHKIDIDGNLEYENLIIEKNDKDLNFPQLEDRPLIENSKATAEQYVNNPQYAIYFQKSPIDRIQDDTLDEILFDSKFIRDDEKDVITFTKRGLIKFAEELLNLTDFDQFYNKNNLILSSRKNGSKLSTEFILGQCDYKIEKSLFKENIKIKNISEVIYQPEKRIIWDTSVKSNKIIEGDENAYIIYTHMHSPVFFISERDVYDKRTEFIYNDIYYCFTSSVEDQLYPVTNGVVRCKIFINIYIITSDEKYFYFMSFNQLDAKMKIPDSFMNMMLPFKVSGFYKTLIEEVNKNIS